MKKFLAFLAVAFMVVSMTACSNTPADPSTSGEPSESKFKVATFYYSFSDTYLSSVRLALEDGLHAAGIETISNDAGNSQTTQNEQIDTAITQGVDALIVNVVDTASIDNAKAIVEKAKNANIPVIFFNREFDAADNSVINSYDKTIYVGTDPAEAGHMQGKMAGDYLLANYDALDLNGDGVLSYAMFKGELGNPEADFRTQFGQEDCDAILTAAGKPAMSFYDAKNTDKFLPCNWDAAKAQEAMQTLLTEYSETNGNMVEVILCNNDGMAEGVISALNAAGYNDGGEKTIPVFGVDATDAAKALIDDGKMAGTIKQDAEAMAKAVVDVTVNILNGKEFLDGTTYVADPGTLKIRIPYATYMN